MCWHIERVHKAILPFILFYLIDFADDYPLNDRYTKLLSKRLPELIERLDSDDMFLNELLHSEDIKPNTFDFLYFLEAL